MSGKGESRGKGRGKGKGKASRGFNTTTEEKVTVYLNRKRTKRSGTRYLSKEESK